MPVKKCIICEGVLPQRRSKFCSKACDRVQRKNDAMAVRVHKGDPTVGLGKGGSNKKGKEHDQYISGMGNFYSIRKHLRETVTSCNRCGKDLKDAGRYEWCVHHKDHDRTNNVLSNFEMLCKRCHQIEHECHLAFTK